MFKFLARFASRSVDPKVEALRALAHGDYAAAEGGFDALLDAPDVTPSERAFLLNKRGVTRVHMASLDAARGDFEAALQVRPRFAPALANLGNLLLEAGRPSDAVTQYEAAIAADDAYAIAYLNLGVAYRRLGRLDESVRALRKAQRLEGGVRWKPSRRA